MGSDDEYDQDVLRKIKKELDPNLGMVYGSILLRNSEKEIKILKFKTPEQYKEASESVQSFFIKQFSLEI